MVDKFDQQKEADKQSLFREREVVNLAKMIYESTTDEDSNQIDESLIVDTNRYDVHESKLQKYL